MKRIPPSEVKERLAKLRGWAFFLNAKKLHLIDVDCRSLCGRWAYLGTNYEQSPPENEQCTCCLKNLAKLQAIAEKAPT